MAFVTFCACIEITSISPSICILHFYHEYSLLLKVVIVGDNVRVIQTTQDLHLERCGERRREREREREGDGEGEGEIHNIVLTINVG